MQVPTMQALTMQAESELVEWDQVLLSQVGDLVVFLAVEACMVVAGMLAAADLALVAGAELLSKQAQDVELDRDQPTSVAV